MRWPGPGLFLRLCSAPGAHTRPKSHLCPIWSDCAQAEVSARLKESIDWGEWSSALFAPSV